MIKAIVEYVMNDEVINILLDYSVARTISRHAIVVYHLLTSIATVSYTSKTIACACLLYALKERNKTHLVSNLRELRGSCNDCEVVALELFLTQTIRRKILLIEGCIRLSLRKLVDLHPELSKFKEDLVLIALLLAERLYRKSYCLLPESAAMATLIAACNLLALSPEGLSDKLQTQQVSEMVSFLSATV
ncbi:unnamed protein product [Phytomonas sp. EM1]|nr:unnamed protein product [Phytomonas sp. EM1]|eukprot:CCW63245.1 unnamed protein product [Phytomonas sp. isolate EM1]